MRVIIAGGRDNHDREIVNVAVIASKFGITEVVSGTQRGVDTSGELWALANNRPLKRFPPDFERYGSPEAFRERNQQMANYAEALIAIWDGHSTGTHDMIDRATKRGLKIYIHKVVPK